MTVITVWDKAHQLARILDLVPEWWTGNSVLDRSDGPVHTSSAYIAFHDWHRCREVRLALLSALAAGRKTR
jgi:hypothetical protein